MAPTTGTAFSTRGVYFHDGFDAPDPAQAPLHWGEEEWRREVAWLRFCGIDAIEFATMLESSRIPSTEVERARIRARLRIMDLAHQLGMKFGYILSNTVVSTVPEGEPPGGQLGDRAKTLCPREPGNFERTVDLQSWYMMTYREADFFEEFAADWGACGCGRCDVTDYLRYVRAFAERLQDLHPGARLYANTWSIAYWARQPSPPDWRWVFDHEITGTREVCHALPDLPSNVHLALPCHHLYRPLVYSTYGSRTLTPAFPLRSDLETLYRAGREVLAWPHFVMDDDAYRPAAWGLVHVEARYIQALLKALRAAGIEHVMGNLYLPYLQLANTYAYGRLLDDPDADAWGILRDFSALVAHPDDLESLTEVLAWLDNSSYWQEQMPADGRPPAFSLRIDRARASRMAVSVRPHPCPDPALPMAPVHWLAELRRSISAMSWAP
jgi:hypothetical protein